jgi:hypothetical protein
MAYGQREVKPELALVEIFVVQRAAGVEKLKQCLEDRGGMTYWSVRATVLASA